MILKGLVDPNAPVTEVKEVKHATLEQLELSVEAIEGGLEFPRPDRQRPHESGDTIKKSSI